MVTFHATISPACTSHNRPVGGTWSSLTMIVSSNFCTSKVVRISHLVIYVGDRAGASYINVSELNTDEYYWDFWRGLVQCFFISFSIHFLSDVIWFIKRDTADPDCSTNKLVCPCDFQTIYE